MKKVSRIIITSIVYNPNTGMYDGKDTFGRKYHKDSDGNWSLDASEPLFAGDYTLPIYLTPEYVIEK